MVDTPGSGGRTHEVRDVEDAADGYLATLAANGVEYFFNSPGTEYAPLWDHFAAEESAAGFPTSRHGVSFVLARHEELAMQMAMGYTFLTGEPQAVGLHVNVGSLHAAMSLNAAHRSRLPVVVFTSHADTHEGDRPGGAPGSHYLDFNAPGGFEDHFARYAKWLAHPERSETAPRYLARALRVARTAPAGPSVVNLARELLYDDVDRSEVIREVPASPSVPAPPVLEDVADELAGAANPAIVAGMGARDPAAAEGVVALAERLGAPMIESPKWAGGIPVEHPLSLGDRTFADHYLAKDVDLVLVVDSARPWYPPVGNAPDARVVALSPEPEQVKRDYWNYPADVLLAGDPAATLAALLEAVPERADAGPVDWAAEHDRLRAAWTDRAEAGRGAVPIDPFWLCAEFDRHLPDDAVIVEETTVHKGVINNLIETRERAYVGAGRALAGGRGGGLGMALGAKLAEPDRPVVALVGDGAYHYNPATAALGAAEEHGLPIMVVVLDNGGYSSQRGSHASAFPEGRAVESGRFPGSSIEPRPDYAGQAAAFGAHGAVVEAPDAVAPSIATGLERLADGQAVLLDVVVDESSPRGQLDPPA